MSIESKLGLDKYVCDEQSHIALDAQVCEGCKKRYCLTVCPARVYRQEEGSDAIQVEHLACLECGTCIAACEAGGLSWRYPQGGFGVKYRFA
ncbi:MAG: 4Fe-4S dicluster domain-containing protein [Eggerthellaceae bacterium]|nr:4Fe-4S dicluster domain-containing protein [Eggerthellaceae bacterium]